MKKQMMWCAGVLVFASGSMMSSAALADEVIDWNNQYLDTIRAIGGGPTGISRTAAMMHTAMYDAVEAIDHQYQPYHFSASAPADTSKGAAVAVAAHDILRSIYPARASIYDTALTNSLAAIPNSPQKTAGMNLGAAAAADMITLRSNDGSNVVTPYTPGTNPGDWRPDPVNPGQTAHAPGWGNVTPWGMTSGSQFRPVAPPSLTSAQYTASFNQVKELGSRTSATRTAEQTRQAWFWANDADGTYKPPGHLNHITQEISAQQGLNISQNARLFALANLAMADAGIAAWDCKFNTPTDFWRPVAGIREADTDGNAATVADPNWLPLSPFTPPFPAYISGHATFGAAHAAAMQAFFGTDNLSFTITSEDPSYIGPARTYGSFSSAAMENAMSRVFLGVHWDFDSLEGNNCGTLLGNWDTSHLLLAVPTPSGVGILAGVLVVGGRRRRK